jgi:isopentenyl-diphosphate delta-isomerase type 1
MTEYLVLVDENDKEIGVAEKMTAHAQNQLHRAFSVFIFRHKNSQLELLLQQRALTKYHSAGLWTNTCCSHPRPNEDIIQAGERRLAEELGINTQLKNLGYFHYQASFANGLHENEIDHVLVGEVPEDLMITPNPDEVHALRWVTLNDLELEIAARETQFTPWLKKALAIITTQLSIT